jgi:hypothetical protein
MEKKTKADSKNSVVKDNTSPQTSSPKGKLPKKKNVPGSKTYGKTGSKAA